MSNIDLGYKRRCTNCTSVFFDLCKIPIVCPKCSTTMESLSSKSSKKGKKKNVDTFTENLFLVTEIPKDDLIDEDDVFFPTEE